MRAVRSRVKAALQNLASGNEDNRRAMQGMGYSVRGATKAWFPIVDVAF